MMKGIRIVGTGSALPEKVITNDDLSRLVDTNDEWITTRTGIKQRYQCEQETCVSLAVQAAEEAVSRAGIDRAEIGVVLVATQTPDYIFPSAACLVQKELGLSEEVMAFDIGAACTGFLMGLGTARALLEASPKPYALVIGSEQLSKIIDYTDRSTCILFGDGAAAVVIESADKSFRQKSWARGNREVLSCLGPGNANAKLQMLGSEVFRFAVTALAQAIEEVLGEEGITMAEVDYCICHQANARIISHVMKKYPGFEDKFYMNIEKYGNTSAASIPLVLDELFREGKLRSGSRVICVGFGAGLTWSGLYMEV